MGNIIPQVDVVGMPYNSELIKLFYNINYKPSKNWHEFCKLIRCTPTSVRNRNIIEIGPGEGSLTEEILNKKPKSLTIIEKDNRLATNLKKKYINNLRKAIKSSNEVILATDDEREREAMIDFNALSTQLKKMPVLLGSDITVYDFSVAAVLSGILFFRPNNWLTDMANDFEIFPEYLGRVSERLGGYEFVKDWSTTFTTSQPSKYLTTTIYG